VAPPSGTPCAAAHSTRERDRRAHHGGRPPGTGYRNNHTDGIATGVNPEDSRRFQQLNPLAYAGSARRRRA